MKRASSGEGGDLSPLLKAWPYRPERSLRVMHLRDGREILQVRIPLGVEQIELDGRPDGRRPHGVESYLAYYLRRKARCPRLGTEFRLDPKACRHLFEEVGLYFHRYSYLFQLRDWDRTLRDIAHNLSVLDLVRKHAEDKEDQMRLEPWRPFLIRIQAIACAFREVGRKCPAEALRTVHDAVETIRRLSPSDPATFEDERRHSLELLTSLASELRRMLPVSEEERLERALQAAIAEERFEDAALLRDRILALREGKAGASRETRRS